MSTTSFAVNDTNAVKLWSKVVSQAERDTLDISKLIGEDQNSIIQEKTDLAKGPGDQVTYNIRIRLSGRGVTEGQRAQGNGEGLSFYSDSLLINELGHVVGVKNKTTIDAQRVPFNLREEAKDALADWWKDRKSVSIHNHWCGYTPANTESATSGSIFCGMNTVVAHSAGRKIFAGSATTDQGLGSSDTFTVSLIDKAKELAMTGNNIVRPIMVGGQPKHVMYLDVAQVTSLRTNATSGGWQDIQKNAIAGGQLTGNPIYTGALGEWNNVILRQSQDITQGVNSSSGAAVTTVRRAVLLGAQSAAIGYGKANTDSANRYRWSEEIFDHDRELEIGAFSIWGCKKVVYNSTDYGVVTVSTYAVRQS